MNNTFGNLIKITLFGESHTENLGFILEGLPKGLTVDNGLIAEMLTKRRPKENMNTARVETDEYTIESGVENGVTNGEPLKLSIKNNNKKSEDYEKFYSTPRPSHADYTSMCKYGKKANLAGGGIASGRMTAPLVAAGAIIMPALIKKGILIGTHLKEIAGVSDRDFSDLKADITALNNMDFAVLDLKKAKKMQARILKAKAENDSVGGISETAVLGLPVGVGEPWFDSVESMLSHALFSIPSVKAVEFGDGFAVSKMLGSTANDVFVKNGERIETKTNHNGGINGGITNGMPVVFRCGIKPTPSILKPQKTLNLETGKMEELVCTGRHDTVIVNRARVVIDSVTALVLADLLSAYFGKDWLVN